MDIERKPSLEEGGEGIKLEKKEAKEKVEETFSAIKESIEKARKLQEENPENEIPRLIWGRRRLEENDPDYEEKITVLERVFKKLGVDFTKETAQDLNSSLYQTKAWEEWVEEEKAFPGRKEQVTIEIQKTNEPDIALVKRKHYAIDKEGGDDKQKKVLVTDYSLFINLAKKESK